MCPLDRPTSIFKHTQLGHQVLHAKERSLQQQEVTCCQTLRAVITEGGPFRKPPYVRIEELNGGNLNAFTSDGAVDCKYFVEVIAEKPSWSASMEEAEVNEDQTR